MFRFIKNRYGSKKGLLKSIYYFFLYGSSKKYRIIPNNVERVVFVCKGNICRSALAEAYFRSISKVDCCSVGLNTTSGKKANERITNIAEGHGIPLDSHVTTAISDFTPKPSDLYVCMEPEHINQLKSHVGPCSIVLLGMFGTPEKPYIHDPYNTNDEFAIYCIKYIIDSVNKFSAASPWFTHTEDQNGSYQ